MLCRTERPKRKIWGIPGQKNYVDKLRPFGCVKPEQPTDHFEGRTWLERHTFALSLELCISLDALFLKNSMLLLQIKQSPSGYAND